MAAVSQESLRKSFGANLDRLSAPTRRCMRPTHFRWSTRAPVPVYAAGASGSLCGQIRERGVEPVLIDVSEFLAKGGGSIKCMILDWVLRELPMGPTAASFRAHAAISRSSRRIGKVGRALRRISVKTARQSNLQECSQTDAIIPMAEARAALVPHTPGEPARSSSDSSPGARTRLDQSADRFGELAEHWIDRRNPSRVSFGASKYHLYFLRRGDLRRVALWPSR